MKFKLLLTMAIATFIAGCDDTDEETPQKNPQVIQKITLVSPTNTDKINPCCTNFTWQYSMAGKSRLVVSKDSSFANVLFDTTVSVQNFNSNFVFEPNTKYFWRVSNDSTQSSSTFMVKDLLNPVAKVYANAHIRRYSWWGGSINSDTSFTGTVTLTKVGSKIQAQYTPENIDRLLEYRPHNTTNSVMYLTNPYTSNGASLKLNYVNDSITFENKMGGLGGGVVWIMRMKK